MGAHNGGRHALLTEAQIAVALEIARAEALSNGFSFKRNRYALKKSATKKRSP
jgi:hypothetical protein